MWYIKGKFVFLCLLGALAGALLVGGFWGGVIVVVCLLGAIGWLFGK